jgi:Secretion system C-terminal sorting domain
LTYTIRFQNTGNAEAYRVVVVDTIQEKLDLSALEMVAASHKFVVQIEPDTNAVKQNFTVVKWIFDNINLVDSTAKEACSHGFVKYRIKNMKDKTNYFKDSILNKAAIYFDFNAPVITNTAMTTFSTSTTPTNDIEKLKFQAYPNPTSNWVTITCDNDLDAVIDVTNVYGQLINRQILRGSKEDIDLSNFTAGIYYITVKSGNKIGTVKVMKR